MTEFLNTYGTAYVVTLLCLLQILTKWMTGHTYKRLLRAAKDMGHTKHPFMKSLCMKFETCYKLKIGVPNVGTYVEKYLCQYRVLGLRLHTWDTFCNQCMLLAMTGSLCAGMGAIVLNLSRGVIFVNLFAGVLGSGLVLLCDNLFGIQNKRNLLRLEMMDYLENIFKPRLENETFHSQMLDEYQRQYFEDEKSEKEKVVSLPERELAHKKIQGVEVTKEEEEVILDVLREYM